MRKLILLLIICFSLTLTSCSFKGYIDHIFGGKNKVENSLSFIQDEYIVSKGETVKVFVKAELEDYSYLDHLVYSLDDTKYGSISEEGIIVPNSEFIEGETTIRARIEELHIEAFTNVLFTESTIKIDEALINNNADNRVVIDSTNNLQFISKSKINHNDYEIHFLSDDVDVILHSSDGFQISIDVLGKINYYLTLKDDDRIIYRNSIYSKLRNDAIEKRARALLSKNDFEIVTKEELASIDNLDDGSCFVYQNIDSFDDFYYFPLISSLNLSHNNIQIIDLNLENLTYLNASYNSIKNIVFPENDSLIEKLDISYNDYDLSKFDDTNLSKLKMLYANDNYSSNKGFIMNGNDDFFYLNIGNCGIVELSINTKQSFTHLLAGENKINDLSSFINTNFKVLDIANSSVSSLDFLDGNNTLVELYVGGNPLSTNELSHISDNVRAQITRLNLSIKGSVDEFDFAQFIYDCRDSLTWLQIYGMGLTDISFISKDVFPKLEYIKVSHNPISDYSSLEGIKTVVKDYEDYRQE